MSKAWNKNTPFVLIVSPTATFSLLNVCKYFVLFLCHFWKTSCPLWSCYLSKRHFGKTPASCKHAVLRGLMFISISPNGASSSSHWLNDKHQGLCLLLILWGECRQKINKLLILHPIWQWLLSFPRFSNPTPNFPPLIPALSPKLLLCRCSLHPPSLSLDPPLPFPSRSTFLCSIPIL